MFRNLIGLFFVFCSLCPMVSAQGRLQVVTVTTATTGTTLEALRRQYSSPYVVSEVRTAERPNGAFRVYVPGFNADSAVDSSKSYIVRTTAPVPVATAPVTTPTVGIHPGVNLIAPPAGLNTAQAVISELGLAALAKTNTSGKFEAVLAGTDDFAVDPGAGYVAIPRQRSRGRGLIFSQEDEFQVWHLKTMTETASDQWSTPTTFGPFSSGDFDPSYTADGTKVLFASSRGCPDTIGLFQVDAGGTNLTRFTGTTANGDCAPVMHQKSDPRGSRILAQGTSTFPGARSNFGVIDFAGSGLIGPIFITDSFNERNPIFSADGQTIYFLADWDGTLKLYSVPISIGTTTEFSDARRLAKATKLSDRPATAEGLSVAPSGDLIFASNGDIWVRRWDGAEANLTNTPGLNEKEASFSPDGSRIAYVRTGPSGRYTQVWVMAADGSGQRMVHDGGTRECSINHAWKP